LKLLIIILLLGALTACSAMQRSAKVSTEQGEFSYYLERNNKPTIVLESGLGDDMTSWTTLIEPLKDVGQVFAYNRAGFSGSSSKNKSRDGLTIVDELRGLLGTLHLPPPYVLVGHSLGGAYMELYAKTYPKEVSGLILLDPNSSKYPQRCEQAHLDFCEPPSDMPKWAEFVFPAAIKGEIQAWHTTHQQVNQAGGFSSLPLVVVSASHVNENPQGKQQLAFDLYTQVHSELASSSPNSKHILCDTCSHYIHQDEPSLVLNAVRWVLDNQNKQNLLNE
jgi:pimeloyl-ACP methyl ester carboxylesterase